MKDIINNYWFYFSSLCLGFVYWQRNQCWIEVKDNLKNCPGSGTLQCFHWKKEIGWAWNFPQQPLVCHSTDDFTLLNDELFLLSFSFARHYFKILSVKGLLREREKSEIEKRLSSVKHDPEVYLNLYLVSDVLGEKYK